MKTRNEYDIVVIGGGAAGLIAAWKAAIGGADILLLEKNSRLGIKILISGGGKCNITHADPVDDLLRAFRKNEARFLRYSFHRFTNERLLELLQIEGVDIITRPDGRIFPQSSKAGDVVYAFQKMMEKAGVEIRTSAAVNNLTFSKENGFKITLGTKEIQAQAVILATGGVSYPKTGTTGDGYKWVEEFGHEIVPLRAALAPIILSAPPPPDWQGIAVRDCVVSARVESTVIAAWRGDMLFTHFGISGPAVLEISRDIIPALEQGKQIVIEIDCMPGMDLSKVDNIILAKISEGLNRNIDSILELFLPANIIDAFSQTAGIDPSKKCHQLKREERMLLALQLKRWPIGTVKEVPLDKGEVTAGGVALGEVDNTTMESKKCEGLYLCGEILDIAGPVGGYNLQAAFSTGYVAGEAAAKKIHREA